jgi:hypothetical protein
MGRQLIIMPIAISAYVQKPIIMRLYVTSWDFTILKVRYERTIDITQALVEENGQ